MATRLKEAVDAAGISYSKLGAESHITRSQISQQASGRCHTSITVAVAVAPILGVSSAWLLGLTDYKTEKEIYDLGFKDGYDKGVNGW